MRPNVAVGEQRKPVSVLLGGPGIGGQDAPAVSRLRSEERAGHMAGKDAAESVGGGGGTDSSYHAETWGCRQSPHRILLKRNFVSPGLENPWHYDYDLLS